MTLGKNLDISYFKENSSAARATRRGHRHARLKNAKNILSKLNIVSLKEKQKAFFRESTKKAHYSFFSIGHYFKDNALNVICFLSPTKKQWGNKLTVTQLVSCVSYKVLFYLYSLTFLNNICVPDKKSAVDYYQIQGLI